MNRTPRIAAYVYPIVTVLAFAAAGVAHAESPTPEPAEYSQFTSTKTRAQVQQELFQARRDGSLRVWSTQYNPLTEMKVVNSREQVRTDLLAAGAQPELTGEDSGSFALNRRAPAREAAPLMAQAGQRR